MLTTVEVWYPPGCCDCGWPTGTEYPEAGSVGRDCSCWEVKEVVCWLLKHDSLKRDEPWPLSTVPSAVKHNINMIFRYRFIV